MADTIERETQRLLGFGRRKEANLHGIVAAQLPSPAFNKLVMAMGVSRERIIKSLDLKRRTVLRRIEEDEPFDEITSDKLARMAYVFTKAIDVFNSKDSAQSWLIEPNAALDNEAPIEQLTTTFGFQNVVDLLGRIEYGVYS